MGGSKHNQSLTVYCRQPASCFVCCVGRSVHLGRAGYVRSLACYTAVACHPPRNQPTAIVGVDLQSREREREDRMSYHRAQMLLRTEIRLCAQLHTIHREECHVQAVGTSLSRASKLPFLFLGSCQVYRAKHPRLDSMHRTKQYQQPPARSLRERQSTLHPPVC